MGDMDYISSTSVAYMQTSGFIALTQLSISFFQKIVQIILSRGRVYSSNFSHCTQKSTFFRQEFLLRLRKRRKIFAIEKQYSSSNCELQLQRQNGNLPRALRTICYTTHLSYRRFQASIFACIGKRKKRVKLRGRGVSESEAGPHNVLVESLMCCIMQLSSYRKPIQNFTKFVLIKTLIHLTICEKIASTDRLSLAPFLIILLYITLFLRAQCERTYEICIFGNVGQDLQSSS